jgi:hypothetical protein
LERYNLEDLVVDGRIILKLVVKKWDGEAWNGLLWLRVGTMWQALASTIMHQQVPAEYLLASQEELCSMELATYGLDNLDYIAPNNRVISK